VTVPVAYAISTMGVGGTPRHLVEVLGHLDRRAFAPSLHCFDATRPEYALLPAVRSLGVEVVDGGVRGSLRGPRFGAAVLRMAAGFRRRRVRVVHSYLFDANLLGTLAARLARVPVALVSKRSLDRYGERRRRLACRVANRLATRVMANAEAVRRNVHEAEGCPLDRIVVVPNGIDLGRIPSAGPAAAPVVGTIGRLATKKGQADLLEAAPLVLDRVPAATFLLVGDGPLRGDLERRARELGIADRVRFRGAVPDGAAVLPELSVFALPSHMEGMSNGLLEAMAAGLPVVATDVGGNPEVVVDGETGFVVPPRDPAALAEAILVLLKDPDRGRAMGAAGRARVAEHYTVQRMVARLEALYASLLAAPGRRDG